ncbi:MAG: tRNA 2-thiouridine(34) synthase MnmA [Candidatus Paceibacterota bacterium]|jgi:tRNA-specific 2-thiouridylase
MASQKTKIVCAMSGGIDSSVSAASLKKAGFDVIGIFMKFWSDSDGACRADLNKNRCCSAESENRARKIAGILGIPFYVFDLREEFKQKVVDDFLAVCKTGATPNPCVGCNKKIKFGLLIEKALALGADLVATGHYAEKRSVEDKDSKNIGHRLFTSKDEAKDQTYFLYRLSQSQLEHIVFPVGGFTKKQVRKMADKFKLPFSAEVSESQEACFISGSTRDFLKKYLQERSGKIIERIDGGEEKIIGDHSGLWFYTIGQRKGMGMSGGPYYVLEKDMKNNRLIVTKNEKDLEKKEAVFGGLNWISGKEPDLPLKAKARIRYRHPLVSAVVGRTEKEGEFKAVFGEPQKAVTPGQSIVFYSERAGKKGEREVLGGGTIIC